ncbi:MAG TPA: hypothetical protein VME18_13540 [Acidobacteriaceae bacterium]|jgi:hypothetical protein|nr:hypothetical protein [Acidobacteriaceae bacterium]
MSRCLTQCRKTAEDQIEQAESACGSRGALRAIGWTSVALGVAALGLFVGRELRLRYVIRHRTPSDFFSHAGEDFSTEFGMGI